MSMRFIEVEPRRPYCFVEERRIQRLWNFGRRKGQQAELDPVKTVKYLLWSDLIARGN